MRRSRIPIWTGLLLAAVPAQGCNPVAETKTKIVSEIWRKKYEQEIQRHADSIRQRDVIVAKLRAEIIRLQSPPPEHPERPLPGPTLASAPNTLGGNAVEIQQIEHWIAVLESHLKELREPRDFEHAVEEAFYRGNSDDIPQTENAIAILRGRLTELRRTEK